METNMQTSMKTGHTIPPDSSYITELWKRERTPDGGKVIHKMTPDQDFIEEERIRKNRQIRTAAYCRVSTREEEQHLSYETQVKAYTDKIMSNPEWQLVGIFADEGITGTSTNKRKDFQRMISWCKQGKIDMILTKSVSRFARNTVDSLKFVRILKDMGIGVIFEKEGLDTLKDSNEFILTIYSSLAQAESESHSGNVKWGRRKKFEQGRVPFAYKHFLGYRKGEDGQPEIVPEEAGIVREIYALYLSGESETSIAEKLTENGYPTPAGKQIWRNETIRKILQNEKYMGDAILQKTFVENCITKKVEKNRGQIPKYYIENNHVAIIEKPVWNRVQEEMARRRGKRKVKEVGTITEQGKYSSKYALTELLVCGECGTPYRRITWTIKGKKKIVWRCISRLDYGKCYCKTSPSIEETVLQEAILKAIKNFVHSDQQMIEALKVQINIAFAKKKPRKGTIGIDDAKGLDGTNNSPVFIRARICEIDSEINELIDCESKEGNFGKYDEQFTSLHEERTNLLNQLKRLEDEPKSSNSEHIPERLREIFERIDELRKLPLTYDEKLVRQMIECVRVISKDKIQITFRFGLEKDVDL